MVEGHKISVVCGVKNRPAHLSQTLPTWLRCPEIDEVVVVDWSSREPIPLPVDERVRVVRAEGREQWWASKCHNLEVRLATGDLVLRIDADDLLEEWFFRRHLLQGGEFYCVDQKRVRKDDELHLAGMIYAKRSDFLRVGGYNERLATYGHEDDDLVDRLRFSGFAPRDLDLDSAHHIPHPDEARIACQDLGPLEKEGRPEHASWTWNLGITQRSIAANKHIAYTEPWSPGRGDRPTSWEVEWRGRRGVALEVGSPSSLWQAVASDGIVASSEGISVVCGCRDRAESLGLSMRFWLTHPEISEIVIVDWGSKAAEARVIESWCDLHAGRLDPLRVILVRAEGEETWQPGPCFNLGLRFATGTGVLKLDADISLVPAALGEEGPFFEAHRLAPGSFYAGDWRTARDENERHLSGVIYARRVDLLAANGWNERIVTYGYDDCDLYDRLSRRGLARRPLDPNTLHHFPHSDALRLQNQPGRVASCFQEAEFNRHLSENEPWRPEDAAIRWNVKKMLTGGKVVRYDCRREAVE